MKHLILSVLLVAALAGCSPQIRTPRGSLPDGSLLIATPASDGYVVPLALKDGTRCVAIQTGRGAGITCDFTGAEQ